MKCNSYARLFSAEGRWRPLVQAVSLGAYGRDTPEPGIPVQRHGLCPPALDHALHPSTSPSPIIPSQHSVHRHQTNPLVYATSTRPKKKPFPEPFPLRRKDEHQQPSQHGLSTACRRRQRAALTCLECRRRKVKCDRKHPCRLCIAAQVECTYSSTFDKARALPKQRDARRAISKPTTEPVPETVASPCSSLLSCSSSPSGPRTAEPSLDEGATPIWPQLLANGLDAASGDKTAGLHCNVVVVDARHEVTGPRVLLNKTRMPTSGHVLGAAPPVCPSLFFFVLLPSPLLIELCIMT